MRLHVIYIDSVLESDTNYGATVLILANSLQKQHWFPLHFDFGTKTILTYAFLKFIAVSRSWTLSKLVSMDFSELFLQFPDWKRLKRWSKSIKRNGLLWNVSWRTCLHCEAITTIWTAMFFLSRLIISSKYSHLFSLCLIDYWRLNGEKRNVNIIGFIYKLLKVLTLGSTITDKITKSSRKLRVL